MDSLKTEACLIVNKRKNREGMKSARFFLNSKPWRFNVLQAMKNKTSDQPAPFRVPPCLRELRHIISIKDFSKEQIIALLEVSAQMENRRDGILDGKVLATLFFESSTRTRLSFETAMLQLGGRVMGFADSESSSTKKGESLMDTMRMISVYADAVVLRHNLEGSARLASEVSKIPVINGGDGSNQHPTQTFLDLYTISKTHPDLLRDRPLRVGMLGDLRYGRTVHSLSAALAHFNVDFRFVSPLSLRMPTTYRNQLSDRGIDFKESDKLEDFIGELDVLYVTRIQRERFPDPVEYDRVRNAYTIVPEQLEGVREGFKILHPLPRVNEIHTTVDLLPCSAYFDQAGNGVPVRKALLALLMGVL